MKNTRFILVFFLFLSLFLFKGYGFVNAAVHNMENRSSAAHTIQSVQPGNCWISSQDNSTVKNNFEDKREDFLGIEAEEEDETSFAGKHALAVKYLITFACASVLFGFQLCTKTRLPFYWKFLGTSSDKYIFQRVLRI